MANPDNILIGVASIQIDGVDVGFTKDGVKIRFPREYVDVMADQSIGVVRKGRKSEKMFVQTTLLEPTLARLLQAWDQPASNLSGSYAYLGYNSSCSGLTRTLKLTGTGPNCGSRSFYLYKVVSIADAEYAMSRESEVGLPVEFEALKDPSNSDRFGWVYDF